MKGWQTKSINNSQYVTSPWYDKIKENRSLIFVELGRITDTVVFRTPKAVFASDRDYERFPSMPCCRSSEETGYARFT